MKLGTLKNIKNSFMFYSVLVPEIFLVSLVGTVYTNTLDSFMWGFCIMYIYTLIFTIRYYGLLSLYGIFLCTSTFFIYNCFFFTLLGKQNFLFMSYPINYYFDDKVGFVFIAVCFIFVYFMHISYCLFDKKRYRKICALSTNVNLNKIGIIIMLVFFLPVITKAIIQLNYIRAHGYLVLYTGELADISYPFWTAGSFLFFISGYCIFLASNPEKKRYIVFTLVYLFVFAVNSLKGSRGGLISNAVYCIYYYSKHYSVKIPLKKILFIFACTIIFIVLMGNIRNGYGKNTQSKSNENIAKLVTRIIYGQTTTRVVPMSVIKGGLKYHDYPFLFWPITKPIFDFIYRGREIGQTDFVAQNYNITGAVIMYNISRDAYLDGRGYGSAFIAESYDFFGLNFLGVILFSILLAKFFVFCDFSKLNIKRIWIPILFFMLKTVPILPRSSIFEFLDLNNLIVVYVLFFCASICTYVFKFSTKEKIIK